MYVMYILALLCIKSKPFEKLRFLFFSSQNERKPKRLSASAFPSLSLQTMEDQEFEMVRSISNQPYYSAICIICQAFC